MTIHFASHKNLSAQTKTNKGGGKATLRAGKAETPTNIFNKEDCPCVCHEDDWKKCFNCKNNHKEDGT